MLIECKQCSAIIDATVLNSYEVCPDPQLGEGLPVKYSFLKCPKCKNPFLVVQENYGEGWDEELFRLFPPQDRRVNPSFPEPIKNTYKEALSCFKGKAFTATIIMCRKTLGLMYLVDKRQVIGYSYIRFKRGAL